uniref:Uncharacterized protein n=1 Tax=Hyaloperonospora arabidopsidis (strain Emoy2) TaxID=559515 RepID=M4BPZ4_HYAAE
MPPNWQDKLACCGISYETVNELAMYFERLQRRERQTGRERLNGQAIHGEKGQGRRDQQRPSSDRRRDKRNHREHRDTREDYRDRPGVQVDKKKHERRQEHGKWCSFHKSSSHDSSECFALKKQHEEHKPAEVKRPARNRVITPDSKKRQATVTATATLSLSASSRRNNQAPTSPLYESRSRSKTRVAPSMHC